MLTYCVSVDLFTNLLFKITYSFLHIYDSLKHFLSNFRQSWMQSSLDKQIFPQNPCTSNKGFQIPLRNSYTQNFSTETFSGLGLLLFLFVLNFPLLKEGYGTCLLMQVGFSKTYQRRVKGEKNEKALIFIFCLIRIYLPS